MDPERKETSSSGLEVARIQFRLATSYLEAGRLVEAQRVAGLADQMFSAAGASAPTSAKGAAAGNVQVELQRTKELMQRIRDARALL